MWTQLPKTQGGLNSTEEGHHIQVFDPTPREGEKERKLEAQDLCTGVGPDVAAFPAGSWKALGSAEIHYRTANPGCMLLFSFQQTFVSAVLQVEGILVVPLSPRMYLLLHQLTIGPEGILGILS